MSDKIKILETMDAYYPCIDGPCNVINNYSKNLFNLNGCELAVPKQSKKSGYVDNEIFKVYRVKSTWAPENYRLAHPSCDRTFNKMFKNAGYDIVHTHSPFAMGRYAVKMGKKLGIPVVATLHTKFYDDFMRITKSKFLSNIALRYIMKVYNNADSVWTVNDASCQVLRDYGYKGKIEVVRNGTDLKYPENAEALIKRVNDLHNLEGQKNVFIFVGRTAMNKNLKLMADSLKIVKEKGYDFKMIFVGNGPDMNKFKGIVEENGLNDNFIFTGLISKADRELLQGYYLRSDLFLFPSTFDTSSLVPIEAAAHKLPTLLIKGSYTAEAITDDFNGFLAEETPEKYAERIIEIISNEEKRKSVGEEAHVSVYRSWEMVAKEVLEKYKQIIKEYKETHPKKK